MRLIPVRSFKPVETVLSATKVNRIFSNPTYLFFLFLLFHFIAWTITPSLVRLNLPMDAIEGSLWGQQWEWGYDKNPYLNAWLTAFVNQLSGYHPWAIYMASQIAVVMALWAVWQLAKKMLPASHALLAVLLLECLQYFNFHAIDFNDNTLELGLWAFSAYFFYEALRTDRLMTWCATGISLGLGLMAKYYTLALIAGMGLLMLLNPHARPKLLSRGVIAGWACLLAVIVPHLIWLLGHDFITISYMVSRAGHQHAWPYHFYFPLQFIWQQLQVFLPAVILIAIFCWDKRSFKSYPLKAFDYDFLQYVGVYPLLLTALISLIFGIKLRAGWGMPLLSLWGIIIVAWLNPHISQNKLRIFFAGIIFLIVLMISAYSQSLIEATSATSANFPGRQIARELTAAWDKRYHQPLRYVAGSRWIAGNISYYSQDHPRVFLEWDKSHAPWINVGDLKTQGGIFVWNISENENLPEEVIHQYSHLGMISVMKYNWQRNKNALPPIQIGVAFLAPG